MAKVVRINLYPDVTDNSLPVLMIKLGRILDNNLHDSNKNKAVPTIIRNEAGKLIAVEMNMPDSVTNNEHSNAINALIKSPGVSGVVVIETLLQEQLLETSPMTVFGNSYGFSGFNDICTKIAQTFVAAGNGPLSKIAIKFVQTGCTGDLIVSLQSVDVNGKPTGTILDSVSVNTSVIPVEGSEVLLPIQMNKTANLVQGTKYAIVLDASGIDYGIDKYIYFYEALGLLDLTGGEYLGYYVGGTSWLNWYALQETGLTMLSEITASTKVNMVFQVYVS